MEDQEDLDMDDNPFNSNADKEIMEKDVPERLQVKLEITETAGTEANEEARWII